MLMLIMMIPILLLVVIIIAAVKIPHNVSNQAEEERIQAEIDLYKKNLLLVKTELVMVWYKRYLLSSDSIQFERPELYNKRNPITQMFFNVGREFFEMYPEYKLMSSVDVDETYIYHAERLIKAWEAAEKASEPNP